MGQLDPTLSKLRALRFQAESMLDIISRLEAELVAKPAEATPLPRLTRVEAATPDPRPRSGTDYDRVSDNWVCPKCARILTWGGHWRHQQACTGPKPPPPEKPPRLKVPCERCGRGIFESHMGAHLRAHVAEDKRLEDRKKLARLKAEVAAAAAAPIPVVYTAKVSQSKDPKGDRTRLCSCGGVVEWDRLGGQCVNCRQHLHRWILGTPVNGVVSHTCPCGVTKAVQTDREVMRWNGETVVRVK